MAQVTLYRDGERIKVAAIDAPGKIKIDGWSPNPPGEVKVEAAKVEIAADADPLMKANEVVLSEQAQQAAELEARQTKLVSMVNAANTEADLTPLPEIGKRSAQSLLEKRPPTGYLSYESLTALNADLNRVNWAKVLEAMDVE